MHVYCVLKISLDPGQPRTNWKKWKGQRGDFVSMSHICTLRKKIYETVLVQITIFKTILGRKLKSVDL